MVKVAFLLWEPGKIRTREKSEIDAIIHGTTVATNSIIERKGAVCGLLTTKGTSEEKSRGKPAFLSYHPEGKKEGVK